MCGHSLNCPSLCISLLWVDLSCQCISTCVIKSSSKTYPGCKVCNKTNKQNQLKAFFYNEDDISVWKWDFFLSHPQVCPDPSGKITGHASLPVNCRDCRGIQHWACQPSSKLVVCGVSPGSWDHPSCLMGLRWALWAIRLLMCILALCSELRAFMLCVLHIVIICFIMLPSIETQF